ncbi:HD domain-containing protein [Corynebacterium sp.]|uniref:HD domain-containing protein n=1 Tax=Corynebacterium sp. TaxID=1720 RepID=UPI0028A8F833|nr:HD domain-containing protein [Corynebacterium sp.]
MSQRILRAINTAAWAHDGQLRKGTDLPYVSHVYGVMHLVSQQPGVDENTIIAAVLHDVLEDASDKYSIEDMERDFGEQATTYVRMVTKDKSLNTWQERADDYLSRLDLISAPPLVIAACDKVHNLSSILADYDEVGEELWQRFNSGKESQRWWYCAVYAKIERRLREDYLIDLPILHRYRALLDRFEELFEDAGDIPV